LLNLDILTPAEQRAEGLRKQLLELIEKETLIKSRLAQIEEDMRHESIELAQNAFGTTRTAEGALIRTAASTLTLGCYSVQNRER
jgi:hypothetical protein